MKYINQVITPSKYAIKWLLTVYGEIIVGRRFFAEVSRKLGNLWYLIVMVKGKQIVFTQKRKCFLSSHGLLPFDHKYFKYLNFASTATVLFWFKVLNDDLYICNYMYFYIHIRRIHILYPNNYVHLSREHILFRNRNHFLVGL